MPQNIWKKLLDNKKNQWLILLIVGILLVIIAIPTKPDAEVKQQYGTNDWDATDTEERLANILGRMKGIGEVHVMITYQEEAKVEGVVVVAESGENATIVHKITEVVQALFAVDAHKIKVIDSK